MSDAAFRRIVRVVTRRPLLVLALTALLGLGGAALALRLEPSAATETLVDRESDTFAATERFRRDFGDEPVLVLVKGELERTVLTADLGRVLRLEGCLSGNVPDTAQGLGKLPPVCHELAELRPAKVVYGPGTFINTAANRISEDLVARQRRNQRQALRAAAAARTLSKRRGDPPSEQERLARAAAEAVTARFTRELLQLALRYGLSPRPPTIDNTEFVSRLVFDTAKVGVPKSRFAYLFPTEDAALIQIRTRADLTDAERRRTIDLIEEATAHRAFRPREGARYVVTGVPVVVEGLADAVQRSIFVLLGAALLVMAATLALVFRSRMRLLPLALALAATAMTFGALSLAGGGLTMASIAVLPVLIGLAVDYSIQVQARFDEERERRPGRAAAESAVAAAAAGGPTIVTAGVATAVGFLVLLTSPVPMVRGFGGLLVLGIGLALACAIFAGFAALARFRGDDHTTDPRGRLPTLGDRWWAAGRHPWVHAGRERLAGGAWRALGVALARPRRVLTVGIVLALAGLALDTQSEVVSDVRELVPRDLPALEDVNLLQEETGVAGEIDVTVRADDITEPRVVAWMTRFQEGVLRAHGYRPGKRCGDERGAPELCPALSLPDLFGDAGAAERMRELLKIVPPYFSQGVVTRDRRTANLAFGIRLMPLDRQKEVVDDLERRLDPPAGVDAAVVGLPVLAAEANGALSSPWRRGLTLVAALLGVFLVLLAVTAASTARTPPSAPRSGPRRWRVARAAAVPLIPIVLATGWSGGVLFVLGLLPGPLRVELNPMSVTLGALVIAISTEFSVLLSWRCRQEREAGAGPARAIELAYASTGAAVLASGATAIAGFAALVASDIRMLRDFGIVTVVDLTVSLLGVMLVLPAALMWAEQRESTLGVRKLDPRPRLRALRARRRVRVDAP